MARALVGGPHVELEVAEPASLRALLAELANRYPQVVGEVLEARSFTTDRAEPRAARRQAPGGPRRARQRGRPAVLALSPERRVIRDRQLAGSRGPTKRTTPA